MIRPHGMPPTPTAMSRPSEPVELAAIFRVAPSAPSRMIEPSPKLLVIAAMADSRSEVRLSSPADGVLGDAFAAMIFVSLCCEDLILVGVQKVKLCRLV